MSKTPNRADASDPARPTAARPAQRRRRADSALSSVDNALLLLQLVGERKVMRVSDAAEALGVAMSTAHRLLTALRDRDFVKQDRPNGAYRPGPALIEIGLAAIGRLDIRRVSRPILEQLRDATQETVSLMLFEGTDVRFIDCVESPRSIRVGSRTGIVLPAHCTAGGKAILAALSPSDLASRYPDRRLTARTPNSISEWSELERELAEIRRDGYAINIGEGEPGISAVGTAINDLIGMPVAAIAIAVPGARMSNEESARAASDVLLGARQAIVERIKDDL